MNIYVLWIIAVVIITRCMHPNVKNYDFLCTSTKQTSVLVDQSNSNIYDNYIFRCAKKYGVDAILIKSIIQVESNYDPSVISKSNAIGLMQLKADTAGKDVYELKGWVGQPSMRDLRDASINIELGTAYLSILQKQLEGISNLETRRYALIVAYVNGLNALLKIFSIDRCSAIKQINNFNPNQFCQYIKYHHPSEQAHRYLCKVNSIYILKKQL